MTLARSAAVGIAIVILAGSTTRAAGPPEDGAFARTFLDQYCVACHNERIVRGEGKAPTVLASQLRATGIAFDSLDVHDPGADAEAWERVIQRLRTGSMPPAGRPRPDRAAYDAVASWLESAIDRQAAGNPSPGRPNTVHRLNRLEYRNAVRDLLALEIDAARLLPGDETSDTGFDNNADVLSISTAQLERYLSAARTISRLATGLAPAGADFETFDVPLLLLQENHQGIDLPLGSRGGTAIRHYFPVDGTYRIKVGLRTNWQDMIQGMGKAHQLDVRVDGVRVARFTVGGQAPGRPVPSTFNATGDAGDPRWEEYVRSADGALDVRAAVRAGPRLVTVSFVGRRSEPEGILQPHQAGEVLSNEIFYDGNANVHSVAIGGPYNVTGSGDTPSRRRIFQCRPDRRADEAACAGKILARLARLAYRRPATTDEVEVLQGFFRAGRQAGGSFDAGVQLALERLLVEPKFLLRTEPDPDGAAPGSIYRLSELEVASRLSFFLWSSIPDNELLDLAAENRLTDPPVLARQVRRMLADPRSAALVDSFAAQWLQLRRLADVSGDPVVYPDTDGNLIEAFRRETELFIASTLGEDRSVLDLLGADYTFVNERLARHYGIPGIYGSRFRRITVETPDQRGGILAHGGILALTSYPGRTSPVLRGKWLLDTILDAPPPAPPADVPPLPERGSDGQSVSVRERLEQHRSHPACASCHAMIDPPGFALEHFDGLGAWRSVDDTGDPIDASATMPDGAEVKGLAGLRSLLLKQPEQFASTVTRKLLAYALGRQIEHFDQPTVRRIVAAAAGDDYRWSSLIVGIVNSPAFLMRQADDAH